MLPGSELTRLDGLIGSNIYVADTCAAGVRAASSSIEHLAHLLGQGFEPPAVVAVSLCRTALVGSAHVVHILGPSDPQQRESNARAVLRRQATSHLSAVKAAASFTQLAGLRPPADLVDELTQALGSIGGAGTPEGAMVEAMAMSMAAALRTGGFAAPQEDLAALREHLVWVWHVWSGGAHGWAWPQYVPGPAAHEHAVAPGHWPSDFFQVAAITQLAITLMREALA